MFPFSSSLFDIDEHHGFLPAEPPLRRLGGIYEAWEFLLDDALHNIRTPGASLDITASQKSYSARWRARVRKVCPPSVIGFGMFPAQTYQSISRCPSSHAKTWKRTFGSADALTMFLHTLCNFTFILYLHGTRDLPYPLLQSSFQHR